MRILQFVLLFRDRLAILNLLHFHVTLAISIQLAQALSWDSNGDCVRSLDRFASIVILTLLSPPTQDRSMSFYRLDLP